MLLPELPDFFFDSSSESTSDSSSESTSDSSSESEMELNQVSHSLLLFKFIYFIFVLIHLRFYFPLTKLISGSVKNKLQIKIGCCSLAGRTQLILGQK